MRTIAVCCLLVATLVESQMPRLHQRQGLNLPPYPAARNMGAAVPPVQPETTTEMDEGSTSTTEMPTTTETEPDPKTPKNFRVVNLKRFERFDEASDLAGSTKEEVTETPDNSTEPAISTTTVEVPADEDEVDEVQVVQAKSGGTPIPGSYYIQILHPNGVFQRIYFTSDGEYVPEEGAQYSYGSSPYGQILFV